MMKDLKLRIRLKHKVDGQLITIYNDVFDNKNGIAFYPIEQDKWEVLSVDLFTGLHDKNGDGNICLYEGDILSLEGNIIGNKYENGDLLKTETNILIEGIGTKAWRDAEKKAMDRGWGYAV